MKVAKDWRGNVVPGNVYELGNTDGIGAPSSPGIQAILDGLKAGNAKLVTAYPYTYGKDGYTATGYTDQQAEPPIIDWETGQVVNASRQMLFMNGKLYPFGNDWAILPITKNVQIDSTVDETGAPQPIYQAVPTGKYRVRTRADNNVFDEFIFAADDSGNITGYNPKIYQTGSNSGGFFGSSPLGNFLNDMVDLAPIATAIFAPAYLPLVTGAKTAIQGGDIGDILKSAGTSYALRQIGQQAGVFGDQAATAAQYGTDLGSAQTAMLAAQEAGLGTVADVVGNVIGQVGTSVVSPTITGRDTNPLDVLLSSGVSAATPFVTSQIEGFSDLPIRAQNAINTIVASEMTGRDPTNAVIAEAVRAGKDAYNNESRAIAGGWDSYAQLQDAASLGIGSKDAYLAYQQGAPVDDGTTAGVKEIVEQTQTGPKDDGTAAGIQDIIDQIQSAPESGIQVAGPLPTDVFNVDVGGSPIYGDTSRANTVKPPFGYGLLPISMADQKPEGSYYDVTQNAWFMPTDEVQRLQDQLTGSDQTSTPPILEGGDLGESGSVDTSGGSLGDESDLGPEPTGTTGWQGPMGPMTEEQTKRYTDEFSKYLDSLQGGATIPPNYGVQDLGITQENWQSFDRNLQQMQEEGRLPTQWKPGDNGTFTYTDDDGSTLTIDENGNIIGYTETPVGNLPGETPTGGPNTAGPSMGGATTGATTGGNTPTTKQPTTPATPATPLTPAVQPAAKTDSSSNLLALLALADRPVQQQPQPVPLADIKYYYDFGDDLVPEKPQNTQNMPARFEFFDGGEVEDLSVDDLIRMLQGD